MTSFGAAAFGATSSPAATQAAPPRQSAQAETAKPRKLARPRHRVIRSVGADQEDHKLANLGERLNSNTLAIIAGGLGSTDLAVAQDLAATLDDGDELRILPTVGARSGSTLPTMPRHPQSWQKSRTVAALASN